MQEIIFIYHLPTSLPIAWSVPYFVEVVESAAILRMMKPVEYCYSKIIYTFFHFFSIKKKLGIIIDPEFLNIYNRQQIMFLFSVQWKLYFFYLSVNNTVFTLIVVFLCEQIISQTLSLFFCLSPSLFANYFSRMVSLSLFLGFFGAGRNFD